MSTAADKPVRHILALSGGKTASCARALDMLGPILTRHCPKPTVGGSMWHTSTNLKYMRLVFLAFPNRHTLCDQLSWSHYRTLASVENAKKRQFYLEECAKSGWGVRDLQRQISTQFYERLLANHVDLKKASGYVKRSRPEYWNGSIPWVSAKDFKTFRIDDSEDHVTELALAKINAVHEWICTDDKKKLKSYRQQHAEDSEKGCCQAVFYVRRTIQNGWSRDVLRRRRNAIRRDSVQVEERQGGRMADCLYSAPCSYFLTYHQEFREQLIVEC